jgi:hypothetical protein
LLNGGAELLRLSHIAADEQGFTGSRRIEAGRCFRPRRFVPVQQSNAAAFPAENFGTTRANPFRSARDDDHTLVKSHGISCHQLPNVTLSPIAPQAPSCRFLT